MTVCCVGAADLECGASLPRCAKMCHSLPGDMSQLAGLMAAAARSAWPLILPRKCQEQTPSAIEARPPLYSLDPLHPVGPGLAWLPFVIALETVLYVSIQCLCLIYLQKERIQILPYYKRGSRSSKLHPKLTKWSPHIGYSNSRCSVINCLFNYYFFL